jgi:acyl-CoA thioester hydrolase
MQRVYRWEFSIPPDAIDGNGHVNNVRFVQWMQDVAVAHAASSGATAAAEAAGGTWFARSHHIEYLKEAFAHDRLLVLTWIVDFSRARSMRRFRFFRVSDRALLARAETEWVFVDAATSRPRTIPETVIACFEALGDVEIGLD